MTEEEMEEEKKKKREYWNKNKDKLPMLKERTRPRLKRPCRDCEKIFLPKGGFSRLCDECLDKALAKRHKK